MMLDLFNHTYFYLVSHHMSGRRRLITLIPCFSRAVLAKATTWCLNKPVQIIIWHLSLQVKPIVFWACHRHRFTIECCSTSEWIQTSTSVELVVRAPGRIYFGLINQPAIIVLFPVLTHLYEYTFSLSQLSKSCLVDKSSPRTYHSSNDTSSM